MNFVYGNILRNIPISIINPFRYFGPAARRKILVCLAIVSKGKTIAKTKDCARSRLKKVNKTTTKGFPNHSPRVTMVCYIALGNTVNIWNVGTLLLYKYKLYIAFYFLVSLRGSIKRFRIEQMRTENI